MTVASLTTPVASLVFDRPDAAAHLSETIKAAPPRRLPVVAARLPRAGWEVQWALRGGRAG